MGIVGRSQDSAISQMTWGLLEGSEQKRDMLWLAFARISLPALWKLIDGIILEAMYQLGSNKEK